jgi:hypothetical protein
MFCGSAFALFVMTTQPLCVYGGELRREPLVREAPFYREAVAPGRRRVDRRVLREPVFVPLPRERPLFEFDAWERRW